MFRRVLIANRGEIAARILRACRALKIETVAIHSEADRGAPWLEQADQAVCIGPARSEASYLNADAILQAAEQTDCQAIHPGYGFLAENAVFAARCLQQGIAFVGPGPDAIRRMGDKVLARRTMAAAGLPVLPGSEDVVQGLDDATRVARAIGYPLLLKATAGGGGKGMRLCAREGDLERAWSEASLEAASAFGDPGLYLERFVAGARHVEYQVLGDDRGRVVHLGERECSVQRHHQKLVEEAPSPGVTAAERRAFGGRVADALAASGYRNAGTVEFLRDPGGAMYFMEVNARLQVEHPVTEMVTGVDLVAEQFHIACHTPLRLRQEDLEPRGHAIEFRINAEDPEDDFRPDPGLVSALTLPPERIGDVVIRWDGWIAAGVRIAPHYDSLLGKLIVHGPDRAGALEGARAALRGLRVQGVKTTIPLHLRILDHEGFCRGAYGLDLLADLEVASPGA